MSFKFEMFKSTSLPLITFGLMRLAQDSSYYRVLLPEHLQRLTTSRCHRLDVQAEVKASQQFMRSTCHVSLL